MVPPHPTRPALTASPGKFVEFVKGFALDYSRLCPAPPPSHDTMPPVDNQGLAVKATHLSTVHGTVLAPSHTEDPDEIESPVEAALVAPPLPSPPSVYFQSWQVNTIDIKIDYSPDQVRLPPPPYSLSLALAALRWISSRCRWATTHRCPLPVPLSLDPYLCRHPLVAQSVRDRRFGDHADEGASLGGVGSGSRGAEVSRGVDQRDLRAPNAPTALRGWPLSRPLQHRGQHPRPGDDPRAGVQEEGRGGCAESSAAAIRFSL
jgi:hypothetical protein